MLSWTAEAYWQEKMSLLLDYITDAKIVVVFWKLPWFAFWIQYSQLML